MSDATPSPFADQDFIELECPYCATGIDFLLYLAGTAQGCPNCGNSIVVPRKRGERASKVPIPMEGESVTLRRLVLDDWKGLLEYWIDTDEVQLCEWLKNQTTERLTEDGRLIYLGIETKENPALIGNFGLQFTDAEHLQVAYQFHVNESRITDPLFREACTVLFVLCFGALNVHRMVTQFPPQFEQPCRVLESLGMRREGHFRQDHWKDGKWQDTVMYAFLREEYKQRVASPV